MKIKKVLLAVFFLVWDKWVYSELEELVQNTETRIDDIALEAVDEAIEKLQAELS